MIRQASVMSRSLALLALLVPLASLTGCGKSEEASCGAVSGHVVSLIRAELAKDGDAQRVKDARANLPTLQNALLEACESKKWNERVRKCIVDAKTTAETRECDPGLQTPTAENAATEDQKR